MVKSRLRCLTTTTLILWSLLDIVCSQAVDPEVTVHLPKSSSSSSLSTASSPSTSSHADISISPSSSSLAESQSLAGVQSHSTYSELESVTTLQSHSSAAPDVSNTLQPTAPSAYDSTHMTPSPESFSTHPEGSQSTASSLPTSQQSLKVFYNLTKEYFSWKLKEFPQQTSSLGINDATAGYLDSFNPEHFEKRRLNCEEFLQRAQNTDITNFSEEDMLNYRNFLEELSTYLQNFKYIKFFAPVNFMGGPQNALQYTFKHTVLKSYHDYLKLLSRYSQFTRQSQEIINMMKGNIANGLMPSNWSLKGVPKQIDDLLLPYKESIFYKPFLDIKLNITQEQKENLRRIAQKPIKKILAGLKSIRDFIVAEYLPETRPVAGVASLPGGIEYYKACLKYHTSTDLAPLQIHDLGLNEVARIIKEVAQTGEELGLANMTLAEINKVVQEDPSQKFESKEDLLNTYRKAIYEDLYPLMDQVVNTVPEVNVSVEENIAGSGYASYSSPPIDGSRPGTFYINAKIYQHHKRYEVNALSLHEAVPGHHLQAVNLNLNPKVPDFMKYPDFYRYEDVPAKFPMNTAFVEGWGLYSEYLGNELGLYKDPYQRLGRHSFELLRSCRLVVDTGIHALGWTRQQAIDYLLKNTAMTKKAIENQIDRYITWPGQACAYKVGEIKIKQLRERAEVALGQLFRVQDFHDTVLGCIGSLNILEECVGRYVNKILN